MRTLRDLLDIAPDSPEVERARALVRADRNLIRQLIALRKAQKLSQDDVADLLGVRQPTIAAFERYDNDPKLSTIRRYAQAVGAIVSHTVTSDPKFCLPAGWTPVATVTPTVLMTSPDRGQHPVDLSRADFAVAA